MAENLEEKKMSADGQSFVPSPVTPEGGEAKHSPTGADKKIKVHPKAETVTDGVTQKTNKPEVAVEGYEETEEAVDVAGLFEGLDLSEEFKAKAELVFEAAVNEAASKKAATMIEEIETELQEKFTTTLDESLEEIVENLDSYLDYVVQEWMEENKVAIEAGIKVEMAESFMEGLKELFYEHNVEIDEETIDVVAELEEELAEAKETANKAINKNLALEEELQTLHANRVFETMTEGLSQAQIERFRVLSEKIDHSNIESYEDNLKTIKESFFKKSVETSVSEDLDQEGEELIVEEATQKKKSTYDSVNAYANFLNNLK
jgi:AcrR family transcriptional regulator